MKTPPISVLSATVLCVILSAACGKAQLQLDHSADSLTSSITGSQADIKELNNSFETLTAQLICDGMTPVAADNVAKESATALKLVFPFKAAAAEVKCSATVSGKPVVKGVTWTGAANVILQAEAVTLKKAQKPAIQGLKFEPRNTWGS